MFAGQGGPGMGAGMHGYYPGGNPGQMGPPEIMPAGQDYHQ